MAVEIWKEVIGYEGLYQVSNFGRIKKRNHIFKQYKDRVGYLNVVLTKNQIRKTKKVHRLVAEAFIENKENLPIINHKDGNKKNNSIDNLEWVTYKENSIHAVKTGLIKTKPVICIETNKKYNSVKEASIDVGAFDGHISKVCKGIRNTAGGYHWKYVEEV